MNTERRIALENKQGEVLRVYPWSGKKLQVIRRQDNLRLELWTDTAYLEQQNIIFDHLGNIEPQSIKNKPFSLAGLGQLRILDSEAAVFSETAPKNENVQPWYLASLVCFLVIGVGLSYLLGHNDMTVKQEEELKQQVVKIAKKLPPKPVAHSEKTMLTNETPVLTQKVVDRSQTLRRQGALAALGSLKQSTQKGGLNLGAVNVSTGPGLGGKEGSGGIQTSLYAKGLVSAPLGAGANLQGGGGYGTKGKGGGKAGYGQLSLIGSAGTMPLPLGEEASVAKGLDKDQIGEVIRRNLGQIRFCYEQGLQSQPSLNGRVAVGFTIGRNGLVNLAQVESTTLNAKAVEDCIVLRLKSWKFPQPDGGVDVKVSYPFVLRRSGQG